MKHDIFSKYPADSLELPQRALLTAWDCLSAFRNDLVLIGGLAVRHLTRPPKAGVPWGDHPRCGFWHQRWNL